MKSPLDPARLLVAWLVESESQLPVTPLSQKERQAVTLGTGTVLIDVTATACAAPPAPSHVMSKPPKKQPASGYTQKVEYRAFGA